MFSTIMFGCPGNNRLRWRPIKRDQVSYPPPGFSATTSVTGLPCQADARVGSTLAVDCDEAAGAACPAAGDATGEAAGEAAGFAAAGEPAGAAVAAGAA